MGSQDNTVGNGDPMIRSLVVLLDSAAPSFCYYEPPAVSPEAGVVMSSETLVATVAHAKAHGLSLQVVSGARGPTSEQRAILGEQQHICYVPAGAELEPEDVPVFNLSDQDKISLLAPGRHTIAVLRVGRDGLAVWPRVWSELAKRVRRVVLVLLDQQSYKLEHLEQHRAALQAASEQLEAAYADAQPIELNVLSDRLVLGEPVECGAGIDHLTVDPLGRLHLCPGFATAEFEPVGDLHGEPQIPNRQLLGRDRAPICLLCDAYHCRRCIYLNQRATLEHNTPSWQMCRVSHLEREASRLLLQRLHARNHMKSVAPIAAVSYLDPFEKLTGRVMCDGKLTPVESRSRPVDQAPAASGRSPESRQQQPKPQRRAGKDLTMDGTKKAVGRVTPEERDQIRELFLRKTALTELFLSLAKLDAETLENTPLYSKVVKDMGVVSVEFQAWWDSRAKHYGWEKASGGSWNIDFESCEISLA